MGDFFQYHGSNLAFRQLLGPYSELGVQIRNVGHYQYPARAPSNPPPHYRIKLDMDQFLLDLNKPQLDVPDDDTLFDEWLVGVPERPASEDASLSQLGSSTTPARYSTDEPLSTVGGSSSAASHPRSNSSETVVLSSKLTKGGLAHDECARSHVNSNALERGSSERPTTSPEGSVSRKQRELRVSPTATVPTAIEQHHSFEGSGKVASDAATPASQVSGQLNLSPLCTAPHTQDVGTPASADEELQHLATAAHTLETETGAVDLSCIEAGNLSDPGTTASPPVGASLLSAILDPIPGDVKPGIQRPATLSRQASTTPTLLFGEVTTPSNTATPAEAGTPPESFPSLTAHNRPKKQNPGQAKRNVQRPPTISRQRTVTRTLPFIEGVTASNPATPVLPATTPLNFSLPLANPSNRELPATRERKQYHIMHYRGPDMEIDCWMEPGPGPCSIITGTLANDRSHDGTPAGNLFPVHPRGVPSQHRGRVPMSSSRPYPTNALQARQHRGSAMSLPSSPMMVPMARTPQPAAQAQYPVQQSNSSASYMPGIRRPVSAQQQPIARVNVSRNVNPYHHPAPARQRAAPSNASYQPPSQNTAQLNVAYNGTTVYSARRNLPPGPLVFSQYGTPSPGSARYHPYPRGARGVPQAPNSGDTTPGGQVEESFEATNLIQAAQGPLAAQTPISPLASSLRRLPPTRPRSASSVQTTVPIAAGTQPASEPRGLKRPRDDEEHVGSGRHEKVAVTGQRRPVPKPKPRRQREGMGRAETL